MGSVQVKGNERRWNLVAYEKSRHICSQDRLGIHSRTSSIETSSFELVQESAKC